MTEVLIALIGAISIIVQTYLVVQGRKAGVTLDRIDVHTNSTLTKANARIAELEKLVEKLKAEK